MNLRNRFLILAFLGLLFLIITPFTIAFALGYRFDFINRRLVETGTLMIRAEPRGAEIYLNGKKVKQKAPTAIRFLLPGEYDVEIKKEGYQTWRKHLTILPEQVTAATPENAVFYLFLEKPQAKTVSAEAFDFFANDGQILAATASTTISFENLQTKSFLHTALPYEAGSTRVEISRDLNWAFVWNQAGGVDAFSFFLKKTLDLSTKVKNIVDVQSFGKNELLLLDSSGGLYDFNLETDRFARRKQKIFAFLAAENQYFFLNSNALYQANKANTTVEILTSDIPDFSLAKIIPSASGQFYLLLDKKLFSVTTEITELNSEVEQGVWDEESKTLIFFNSHSIWFFDPKSGQSPELVIRSGSPISNVQINAQTALIFFLQDNTIKAIEINAQVSRNTFDLIKSDQQIIKFYVNDTGQTLDYLEKGRGLMEAKIR